MENSLKFRDIIDIGAEDARIRSDRLIELMKDRNKLARSLIVRKRAPNMEKTDGK